MNTMKVSALCGLAVLACAGVAGAQTWTFEAPSFTTGEFTPLLNRAPNVSPGTWQASFVTNPVSMQVATFAANSLMVGNILYVPSGATVLTITFNQPVTDLSFDFALIGQSSGFALNYLSAAGAGSVAAVNVDNNANFWGGSVTLTGLGGITSIDLFATAPTGAPCEFAIDTVTVPSPGAAAALGLAGACTLRRRRR